MKKAFEVNGKVYVWNYGKFIRKIALVVAGVVVSAFFVSMMFDAMDAEIEIQQQKIQSFHEQFED